MLLITRVNHWTGVHLARLTGHFPVLQRLSTSPLILSNTTLLEQYEGHRLAEWLTAACVLQRTKEGSSALPKRYHKELIPPILSRSHVLGSHARVQSAPYFATHFPYTPHFLPTTTHLYQIRLENILS